ncbi:protein kinase [Paenibacillus pasadenensis]|uniref:serine/threonine protein kinase n=1 Tax=Paenibacillus pasadenensis TaxID=217090 RepID=UPI002042424C|nr:protein kinase [Paenibacillus pasadenensis]MCM3748414.1 protein kinase [Paenibacillus pasadenensis]
MWTGIVNKYKDFILTWRDFPLADGSVWLGRYRIEQFLGRGSYGQAYACTDTTTGERVLLKRSLPSKKNISAELLERESNILRQLNHPQIPKWLRYEQKGRRTALVMELIDGDNLEHELIDQQKTFTLKQALNVLKDLLHPLAHLHQAGYVHRDVRIPNVIDKDGCLYLIDYGLACRIGEVLPEHLRIALKEYHPFEDRNSPAGSGWSNDKRRMRRPDPSSDLYGLGHFFLFMIYAEYEYEREQEELDWEDELDLPLEVKRFIKRLLQKNEPGFRSADECLTALEQLIASLPN